MKYLLVFLLFVATALGAPGALSLVEDASRITTFLALGRGYCSDWAYPNGAGYDTLTPDPAQCAKRCQKKFPKTTSFYMRGNNCGCSRGTHGTCHVTLNSHYVAYKMTPSGGCPPKMALYATKDGKNGCIDKTDQIPPTCTGRPWFGQYAWVKKDCVDRGMHLCSEAAYTTLYEKKVFNYELRTFGYTSSTKSCSGYSGSNHILMVQHAGDKHGSMCHHDHGCYNNRYYRCCTAAASTADRHDKYFDAQETKNKAENDKRNTGYVSVKIKKEPAECSKCMGALCRRHCMQAYEHHSRAQEFLKNRETATKEIGQLEKMLKAARETHKNSDKMYKYHDKKFKEWQKAHNAQHKLDVATNNWYKADKKLQKALKKEAEANTASAKAKAAHVAAERKHDASKALLKEMQAKLKVKTDLLTSETRTYGALKKEIDASKKKKTSLEKEVKALTTALKNLQKKHKTLTTDLNNKATTKISAQKAHESAKAESAKRLKATKGHNLKELQKKAKAAHDIAREVKG